jgi:hypothetical protein
LSRFGVSNLVRDGPRFFGTLTPMRGIVNEVISHCSHGGDLVAQNAPSARKGAAEFRISGHTHARERHLSKPLYIALTFVGRLNNSVRHGFLGNFRGHNAE